jgi:hypothetical protein
MLQVLRLRSLLSLVLLLPALVVSCGDDDEDRPQGECSLDGASRCPGGQECQAVTGGQPACFCSPTLNSGCPSDGGLEMACEEVVGGNSQCFAPLSVKGMVFNLATNAPIEGARVVARDANNAALSGVEVTDAAGNYTLRVPAPRNADGTPVQGAVTLRADASGFLTFPKPPRVAIPVELSQATGNPLTVESASTSIGMLALQSTTGLGTIRGKVEADNPRGAVIVAGGAVDEGGGVTGVADTDGTFAVFNVPAGSREVRGYKAGLLLDPETANVVAGQTTENVILRSPGPAIAVVSGSIQIVNPEAGEDTSVILAVDETFDPDTAQGEAPPGLRVAPVDGAFEILDVPNGNYVVLAAFENDSLVRDPDQAIGGTKIVRITVAGANVQMPESFKVTGALDVVSPDKEQVVSGTPTFVWVDDSGEDHYEVVVFDAFGNKIWEDLAIPGVSGAKNVEVPYGGTALTSGVLYQFRATAIKQGGSSIARTEDLRGVFLFQ